MKRFYFSKLIILTTLLLGSYLGTKAQTTVLNYTGGEQTYDVPAGVTALRIDAIGGAGGYPYWQCGSTYAAREAYGGRVQCDLAVTPGMRLYIYVGGAGGSESCSDCTQKPGGFNGGQPGSSCAGGSGGATDVRFSAGSVSGTLVNPYTSTNRVVVAGAGGGGADYYGIGGSGGGLTGGTGIVGTYCCGGTGGNGGTQGGPGPGVGSATSAPYLGTLGVGGQRYNYSGGGGGYWGGNAGVGTAGGAGGGSSYTDPFLCTNVIHTQGYTPATGNGKVTITVLCTDPGTINGPTEVCVGQTISLSNTSTAPGTWTSSNTAVGTISSSGVVTGLSAGTITITHVQSNPCGGASATKTITVNPMPAVLTGTTATTCTGLNTTLGSATSGGIWESSNSLIATVSSGGVVTALTTGNVTISYSLPTGCRRTTTMLVNQTPYPFSLTGGGNYCSGFSGVHIGIGGSETGVAYQLFQSSSLVTSASGTGGTIDFGVFPTTGSYTGTATNSTTGCTISLAGSATVSLYPNPAAPGGATNVCAGLSATVTDATPGGTWSVSNPSVASVAAATGVVTGITAGTINLTYTLTSTGCRSTSFFQVFAQPAPITGAPTVCLGSSTGLTNTGGGSWASSATGVATVAPGTGLVTGVSAGTATITYTLPTGCNTTKSILVNPLPSAYAVTGGGNYCFGTGGSRVGLAYSNSGVDYQLKLGGSPVGSPVSGSNSGLDFGPQYASGTYTVSANNSLTGCTNNMAGSVSVNVNPLPNMHSVTGGGNVCVGGAGVSVGIDGTDLGIKYQLFNGTTAVGSPVTGTGLSINFGIFATAGTYTIVATNPTTLCTNTMAGAAVVVVNNPPVPYPVTGSGAYCAGGAGLHIMLSNSDMGVSYQLKRGSADVGGPISSVGGAIDFGAQTTSGTYTVMATDPFTTCSGSMSGSASVVISPLPAVYPITGGGNYCDLTPGTHIGLGFSTTGIDYALKFYGIPVDTVSGSGTSLDFGLITVPGNYTVSALNTSTGCVADMSGSVNVGINPLPTPYNVTGGGNFCYGTAGVHVGTSNSDAGVSYQLYRGTTPVGLAMPGTGGAPIDFGSITIAGTYSVVARNITTGCFITLPNTVTVAVDPLPTVCNVTGGGNFCSGGVGLPVNLSCSRTGINYELYYNGFIMSPQIIIAGTGSSIAFGDQAQTGIYTVWATDATTGCMKQMTGSASVNVNSLPLAFDVIGGGDYCTGATGVHVGLSGSSSGIRYQLYNTSAVGAAMTGTGAPLDFGIKTASGTYTVVATNLLTGCSNTMNSSAFVNPLPLPNDYPLPSGGNYCDGGTGINVNIPSSDDNVEYQLYRGLLPVGPAQLGMAGMPLDFADQPNGVYTIRATDLTTTCSKYMPGSTVINKITATPYTVTGGGGYCAGGSGVGVMLSGSQTGWTYELFMGGVPTGTMIPGTGTAINFGLQSTPDVYTVVATNDMYACVASMTSSASVNINALPTPNNVTGGGTYCAGTTGVSVGLDMGDAGINYTLYNGTSAVGTAVPGTGAAVDFGPMTASGTYTVKAVNAATGCANDMAGSASVTVKPAPAAYITSITGPNPLYPGYFCATDSGVHIYLPNSETGVNYQLWRGTTMIGTVVAGTGSSIDMGLQNVAGTYNIKAVQTASLPACSANMRGDVTVNIIPLPDVFNVTGGGSFCPGGAGVSVGLDGSEPGILYNLIHNGSTVVSSLAATGAPLDFGLQTMLGNYTIEGTSQITYCPNTMFSSANVKNDTIYTPSVTLRAYPGTGIDVWHIDSMHAYVTNGGSYPTYQWYVNGHVIPGATNASFIRHEFFNRDSVACIVTASGPCGGNTTKKSLTITLHASGVGVGNVANAATNLVLVPNPNKGTFSIKGTTNGTSDEEMSVEVVNMIGQVVYSGKVMSRNGTIDEQMQLSSDLANGMYILNLNSATGRSVFHFVIEK